MVWFASIMCPDSSDIDANHFIVNLLDSNIFLLDRLATSKLLNPLKESAPVYNENDGPLIPSGLAHPKVFHRKPQRTVTNTIEIILKQTLIFSFRLGLIDAHAVDLKLLEASANDIDVLRTF